MMSRVDTDDLVAAREAAEILGLSHRNSASLHQPRYPGTMPRPVVERGGGRMTLWLRADLARWAEQQRPAAE